MPDKMSIEIVKHSDGDVRLIVADGRVKQYFRCGSLTAAFVRLIKALAGSSIFGVIGEAV